MENVASAAGYALPVMLRLSQRQPTLEISGPANQKCNKTIGEGCSTWPMVGREKKWHVDSYLLFPIYPRCLALPRVATGSR